MMKTVPDETLPLLVGEELAVQRDHHAIAMRIFLLPDIHGEVDGTHDAVSELFMNDFLDGTAIDLHDLIKSVGTTVSVPFMGHC